MYVVHQRWQSPGWPIARVDQRKQCESRWDAYLADWEPWANLHSAGHRLGGHWFAGPDHHDQSSSKHRSGDAPTRRCGRDVQPKPERDWRNSALYVVYFGRHFAKWDQLGTLGINGHVERLHYRG